MEGNGRPQQSVGPGNLQPRPLPRIGKPSAHDQTTQHMHRARPEATEKDEGEAVGAVLDEIAYIFKGGESQGNRDGGGLDPVSRRFEHQQIERQRQQLHDLFYHRRDLHRGGKGIRPAHCHKEGVDVGREQTHPHSGDTKQEKADPPPAHAQSGHQQRRHHTEEDVFDVGHGLTALLVAGNNPNMARVSSRSHQNAGLAIESFRQKQPAVQSRYSETTKNNTPMWK